MLKAAFHLASSFLTPFRRGPGETQSVDAHHTPFVVKRLFTPDGMKAAERQAAPQIDPFPALLCDAWELLKRPPS